jgi:hypothetical protein
MFARLRSSRTGNLILELLMLVVGINIALWFEGKFEDMQDARTEKQYLSGLRDDLRKDVDSMNWIIEQNTAKISRLNEIIPTIGQLAEAPAEQQEATVFEPSSYSFFEPSDFTYRSMQESGDFRLLSDPSIKEGLLRLVRQYRLIDTLQVNFIQALDDEYIPLMMSSFDISEMRIAKPDLVNNLVFRNFFLFALQDTMGRTQALESARDQAKKLVDLVEQQLDPD